MNDPKQMNPNPFASPKQSHPKSSSFDDNQNSGMNRAYHSGIGRLKFFIYFTTCSVLSFILTLFSALGTKEANSFYTLMIPITVFEVMTVLYISSRRLINLGYLESHVLYMLVPVLNIFYFCRCLICPPGYVQTQKLDRIGSNIVMATVIGCITLLIFALYKIITGPIWV